MLNEKLGNELMSHFLMEDYMATHDWLPIQPRRAAFEEYRDNPEIQTRINSKVQSILGIVEKCQEA